MAIKELIVGGGCFWCTEAVFELLKGVSDVESGYANGHTLNPTYRDICTGETGHAEVIKITYDNAVITVDTLLDIFFIVHKNYYNIFFFYVGNSSITFPNNSICAANFLCGLVVAGSGPPATIGCPTGSTAK